MLSGRPFVVGVADFGVTHFIRDFHALVDDLFDTAQCRGVIAAVVFRESLFESIPALEGSLPTVIEGRGILFATTWLLGANSCANWLRFPEYSSNSQLHRIRCLHCLRLHHQLQEVAVKPVKAIPIRNKAE